MSRRLHLDPETTPLAAGELVKLDVERSSYVARVLRAKPGDLFIVFDGAGHEFDATVDRADPRQSLLRLGAKRDFDAPTRDLALLAALTKDGVDLVVQKATELGATQIILISSARSQPRGQRRERLIRIMVGACEQCGRVWAPALEIGVPFGAAIERFASHQKLIAVPGEASTQSIVDTDTCLAIGPEGGWTDAELSSAAHHGYAAIGFGPLTLRATTAAMVGLTAIRTSWGWKVPEV